MIFKGKLKMKRGTKWLGEGWPKIFLSFFFFFYLKVLYGKSLLFSERTSTSIWTFEVLLGIFGSWFWEVFESRWQLCGFWMLLCDLEPLFYFLNFLLKYGWFTMFRQFLVYNKVTQWSLYSKTETLFCYFSLSPLKLIFPNQVLQFIKLWSSPKLRSDWSLLISYLDFSQTSDMDFSQAWPL